MVKSKIKQRAFALKNSVNLSFSTVSFALVLVLMVIGLLFVFEASSIRALNETGDSFYYLKLQFRWVVIGLLVTFIFSKINYRFFIPFSSIIIGVTSLMLIIVLIPYIGKTAGGARSWIDLGFINFQPAEFAKCAIILYLASWFYRKKDVKFFSFIVFVSFVVGLVILQPDMGTSIMLFSLAISMYFLSGLSIKHLLLLLPIIFTLGSFFIVSAPYRLKRLLAFLRPDEDPLGVGFHINQILISITEGGVFGRGFGASRQKFLFLPEAHTDSIFAIISEEIGFVGSFFIIFLFIVLLFRLYALYTRTSEQFGKLLIGGIFTYFGLQIIINLGGMVNIMPLTGVTLPFISYGGSSMLTSCILLGIAMNVSKEK